MISDFIYKYYIDPIRYEQPYNAVETITYALILIAAVYLIYRWFRSSDSSSTVNLFSRPFPTSYSEESSGSCRTPT